MTLEGGVCARGVQRVDCTLASLRGGASALLRVSFLGTAIGSWPLAVQVSAPGDSTAEDNLVEALVTVRPAADLAVNFTESSRVVGPGAARRVPFTLINWGPLVARNVVLDFSAEQSTLLGVEMLEACRATTARQWRCEWPELAVGEQLAADLVAVAGAEEEEGVRREALSAQVWSAYEDPAPTDNASNSELVVARAVADLATRLLSSPAPLEVGEEQALELEITNHGPDRANAIALDVALSLASVSVLEAAVAGGAPCAIEGTAIRCELAAMEVGERNTVRLLVRALAGERLLVRTVVSGASYDPATENDLMTSEFTVSEKAAPEGGEAAAVAGSSAPAEGRSGGGGALDPAAVLGLLLLLLAAYRSRRVPRKAPVGA